MAKEMKTLNGYEVVDAKARAELAAQSEKMEAAEDALLLMSVEGYERIGGKVDVRDQCEKHENSWVYLVSNAALKEITVNKWNYYTKPVTEGEWYHISAHYGNTNHACYFVNAEQKVIGYFPEQLTGLGLAGWEGTITVPNGAVMIYVNECAATNAPTPFAFNILDTGVPVFKKTEDYGQKSDILFGKKLACVGDSITEASNPDGGYFKNYAEIAAERHGMTVYKDGKGGTTMANIGNANSFCVTRYQNVPSDFDILTIWFGWNDAAYAQVGTIDDTDDTTYYGAYKKVLDYYITTYPTKKIGLIVPYGAAAVDPFREAVRKLSELYGVPCLDLADGKKCSLLWGTANDAQLARRTALTYDNTHPNQAGHEYLSTMYESFIKSL